MEAKLGGKVRHGLGAQHARLAGSPRVAGIRKVLFEAAMGLVDARVEDHLGRSFGELLGRHLGQEHNRVMVDLAPFDGVQVAKQVHHLRMPAPPEVRGQRQALVIQRLGGDFGPRASDASAYAADTNPEGKCWSIAIVISSRGSGHSS